MAGHVAVLASINSDITAAASRLPKKGETVPGYSVDMFCGGKGANQAVQCAQMGLDTRVIGMVGKDMQGEFVRKGLSEKGADISLVEISSEFRTGCCSINVDPDGNNTLVYCPGSNSHISKEQLEKSRRVIESAAVFMTQLEVNSDAVFYGLQMAHEAGVTTILNPAPALPIPEDIFPYIDYFTPNETECEEYTGILRSDMTIEEWTRRSFEWFSDKGVRNLCITMGEKGAFFCNKDEALMVPAFPVKPVDTTAAGDSFHGGLVYGLVNGFSVEQSIRIGNACGALSTLTMGAQNSIQPKERVFSFLQENGAELQE